MIALTSCAGKRIAVFGLGGSGLATARALAAGGAEAHLWDDNPRARQRAADAGFTLTDLERADWRGFDSLAIAPGAPLTHPAPHWSVERARQANVEVIGDIELFCREREKIAPQAPFIAITGTNGKSTTTALTAHLLFEAGADVQLGGNIGTPILDLDPPDRDRFHVIEVSSFQIDLAPSLRPTVGMLLNLSPDHIDRHGSMELYAGVKERLIAQAQTAIVSVDDGWCWRIGERRRLRKLRDSAAATIPVSVDRELARGVFRDGAQIVSTLDGADRRVLCDLAGVGSLRGRHNAQNAAFAAACADLWSYPDGVLAGAARTFPGLPHRMEEVARAGRVLYVNDSKATNAEAAACALSSFDDIFWIAGGRAKEGGIGGLMGLMDRVRKVYLIGEAAPEFGRMLQGRAEAIRCGTLEAAVAAASADARTSFAREPVVLLSPACASYDQFTDYESRGDRFRKVVREMLAAGPRARSPEMLR